MKQEKNVVFFVLGVDRNSKGQYLAKILKSQQGVYSVSFDFKTRLMDVVYNPELIDAEEIKRMTYFKECIFLSEKEEIERQVSSLKKLYLLKNILTRGFLVWMIIAGYVLISFLIKGVSFVWAAVLLGGVSVLLLTGLYIKERMLDQMNRKQSDLYEVYKKKL